VLGGVAALLSGALYLLTIVYTFAYLAGLGLTVEMLDRPAELLPWIAAHTAPYLGLWWIFFASLVLLLPAPPALLAVNGLQGSALARAGAAVGGTGITIGLVGVLVNASTAPLLAGAYDAQSVLPGTAYLLSELMGSVGLHLRLASGLLIGLWLGLAGIAVRGLAGWRPLAIALMVVAAFTLYVAAAKVTGVLDLEPVLGLVLALTHICLGFQLLRTLAGPGPRVGSGAAPQPAAYPGR
jgi:hypothetical protein